MQYLSDRQTGHNKVVCVLGPTGSGKSGLALQLAEKFGGALINIDSRQVYLGLPIITAQPSEQEKSICPHLLYGFLPCNQKTTAGMFASVAKEAVDFCLKRGLLPILVGGTGLYAQALIKGIAPIPKVDAAVSAYWQMRCDECGSQALHKELAVIDAEYAVKISPNDKQRVTRALEVYYGTGRTLSAWHGEPLPKFPWPVLKLGLNPDLDDLKPQLARRIDVMLENGAEAEVKRALDIHGADKKPGLSSIGFPELADYLGGKTSLDECKELWLNSTRAYAKRQLTWFKKENEITWLDTANMHSDGVRVVGEFLLQ